MSDQEAPEQKFALAIVGLLVTVLVATVIGIGVWKARPALPGMTPKSGTVTEAPAVARGTERIYFAISQDTLPGEAAAVLARVAQGARAHAAAVVSVSGFHDASGNLATNQDLAKRRAQQVVHGLEAHGVPSQQIVLNKPAQTTGHGDPAEARRVDIRLD